MANSDIIKLIKKQESETFEKKPSLSDISRIVEVVCSFANHKGGTILIGVSDKGKVANINIGKSTIERLADTIVDNTDSKIYPEISTIKSNKKNISRSEYVEMVDCSARTAVYDLQDLVDKKIVKKVGRGKYIRYIRN